MIKRWYATDEGPLFWDHIAQETVRCYMYKGTRYLATSRWSLFWVKALWQGAK